jgi:hypothetical protein
LTPLPVGIADKSAAPIAVRIAAAIKIFFQIFMSSPSIVKKNEKNCKKFNFGMEISKI